MSGLLAIALWALYIVPIIICFRKGKQGMAIGGIFTWGLLSVIGAIRLAKPNSAWARKNYLTFGSKMVLSRVRFGGDADRAAPTAQPSIVRPPAQRIHEDDPRVMAETIHSEPELASIPGLDPIADKLGELSAHFAAAGSSLEVLEQAKSSAKVRVSQRFMGSRHRLYRLTLHPGRRVHTELLEP